MILGYIGVISQHFLKRKNYKVFNQETSSWSEVQMWYLPNMTATLVFLK